MMIRNVEAIGDHCPTAYGSLFIGRFYIWRLNSFSTILIINIGGIRISRISFRASQKYTSDPIYR
jgi:hypothetical protein